jgi:outer membrane immunogenic protein
MTKLPLVGVCLLGLLAGQAMAADMPAKRPIYKAMPPVVSYGWEGGYIGGNAGYSWGQARGETSATVTAIGTGLNTGNNVITSTTTPDRTKINGGLIGLQAGYNWQRESWVFGVEADLQATGQRGDGTSLQSGFLGATVNGVPATGTVTYARNYKLPWFGTFRGRLGVAADRWLLYATGGLAVGEIEASSAAILTFSDPVFVGPPTPALPSSTRTVRAGWVLGAGVEAALAGGWSVKAEYLHLDFGGSVNHAFSTPPVPTGFAAVTSAGNLHARITDDIVRVGLNYRWGNPVVAAY